MRSRIAFIAHDFPPYNVGGSQRPYLMAKTLIESGIDVTIFTLKKKYYPSEKLNFNIDKFNFKVVRTDIKPVTRSVFQKGHYFKLTDSISSRWEPYLQEAILKKHREIAFNYVLVTCPPFSLAANATALSEKLEIPYILDFRDAWSQWITSPYPTYFHYKKLLAIERKAIQKATFVTSTSNQQIKDFIKIHGQEFETKFIYVPNGFQEYQDLKNKKSETDKVRIIYTGSFYFNPYSQSLQNKSWYQKKWYQWLQYLPRVEDWSYRSPLYFFKALEKLFKDNPSLKSKIEVTFAGQKPNWFDQMVSDHSLQDYVNHLGFINKHKVETLLQEADYLLITSSKIPGGKEYSVAGKTFEYISYQKPILAFVSEGEQKEVLKKTGLSYIFNPDQIEDNVSKLESIFQNRTRIEINQEHCNQYKIPINYSQLIAKLKDL